ncbi:MAG: hypothetical protein CMM16_03925 [Rhodospirillaceae bacterium]|nr:hypothetical protein [Rhodospirillaceae bacterium]
MYSGNPAAVCSPGAWIDKDVLQALASENNLSDTAFFHRRLRLPGFRTSRAR